eukprot:45777-Rhodomonas_salina.1
MRFRGTEGVVVAGAEPAEPGRERGGGASAHASLPHLDAISDDAVGVGQGCRGRVQSQAARMGACPMRVRVLCARTLKILSYSPRR